MIERGEERRGRVEAWFWRSSKYRLSYWQGIHSFMPNLNPECKLLTPYVDHFYKATCVTHCMLEIGVMTNSQYNQSHFESWCSPKNYPTIYAKAQLPILRQSAQGA